MVLYQTVQIGGRNTFARLPFPVILSKRGRKREVRIIRRICCFLEKPQERIPNLAEGNLKSILLRNTITNYAVVISRMITSIFTIAMLIEGMGLAFYGYYTLLWEFFMWAVVLDFGFGVAVQKYTAEATVTNDYQHFNRRLSAVIGAYIVMMLLIIGVSFYLSYHLDSIFTIKDKENLDTYKNVFLVFGIGSAISFPVAVFPEVLKGLKRYDLFNYFQLFNIIFTLIGIYVILYVFHYSILILSIYVISLNFLTNFGMFLMSKFLIPPMRIILREFNIANIIDIAHFSAFSYVIMLANLVIYNCDRVVLGVMVGMAPVAIYQVGIKIPTIMEQLTTQYQTTLVPVIASLYKGGEYKRLRSVMFFSNKLTAFLLTGGFVIFIILAKDILFVWLKVKRLDYSLIAYIMLVSVYFEIMFRSVFSRFLLMADRHRVLALLTVLEAILNIGLSIFLIWQIGVVGVAVGTMVPSIFFSLFIIFPLACKYLKTSMFTYFIKVYLPVIIIALPSAIVMAMIVFYFMPLDQFIDIISRNIPLGRFNRAYGLVYLGAISFIGGIIYLAMGIWIYITRQERREAYDMMPGFLKKVVDKIQVLRKFFLVDELPEII